MPLPSPNKNETKREFMDRCLSNENVKKEFDAEKDQNYAYCIKEWQNRNNE